MAWRLLSGRQASAASISCVAPLMVTVTRPVVPARVPATLTWWPAHSPAIARSARWPRAFASTGANRRLR
eukprot:9019549-Pyramimonas_sp.AAC.3